MLYTITQYKTDFMDIVLLIYIVIQAESNVFHRLGDSLRTKWTLHFFIQMKHAYKMISYF